MDVTSSDLVTVGVLVALEGVLSADNALVMAVLVLGLPPAQHSKALRYGLVGGFACRIVATLLAAYLIGLIWVKALGGLYLLYLSASHFLGGGEGAAGYGGLARPAGPWLGLSPFWSTVIRVELINLAFSIDSILVAVAMSPKIWVVVAGGLLGIAAMRMVAAQLLALVRRYPALVGGAFAIIAWVGSKLCLEYLHEAGLIALDVPRWLSLTVIGVMFLIALVYAVLQGPAGPVGGGDPDPLLARREVAGSDLK